MTIEMDPSVSDVLAVLERTPAVLRSLLTDLPAGWLGRHEGEDTFGLQDILGHLIHGEKTDWVPRIRVILESGPGRAFVPFDRRGFGAPEGTPVERLLDEFEGLRGANLAVVRGLSLSPEQLALRGLHPELGGVTLGQLLATWAVHDMNHVAQALRVMSARYRAAVGPWKAFLGILSR
ncbi:MAG TPA: DinB family protein [Vicinamibacteria bacterium]